MFKVFSTVILLWLLTPVNLSLAQAAPGGVKIYSGFLHSLFKGSSKEEVAQDKECSIEFRSETSFSHQAVSVVPEQLTYVIKFSKTPPPSFKKFVIMVYNNDDEQYEINPDAEGKQIGIDEEHHIFDSYLIYLIMGTDIDHVEIVSASKDQKDRYVLDKLEIHDKD